MCYDDNNGHHVIKYLNSQLSALYENAVECAERHGGELKAEVNHRYSYALAKFHHGKHRHTSQISVDDMLFYASFGRPTISFICNHEALLKINIQDGHYNLDYGRAMEATLAVKEHNVPFKNADVEFRVPFRVTSIRGGTNLIGNGEHVISLFILDFKKAQLSRLHATLEPGRQAITAYMNSYLQLLQNAGHHVLFSLPEFSDLGTQLLIDFSETITESLPEVREIRGISVERINAYLSTAWLRAAMIAGTATGEMSMRKGTALAEIRSTWLYSFGDRHFHIKFAAPRVRALCNEELIITFVIDEVLIYETEDFDVDTVQSYSDWEVSMLVHIEHQVLEGDSVTRFKINLNEAHRFLTSLSRFEGCDDLDEDDQVIIDRIIEFFSSSGYLTVLEEYDSHIIFDSDAHWPELFGSDENEWTIGEFDSEVSEEGGWEIDSSGDGRAQTKTTAWTRITQTIDMCGYDQITAISQFAINSYLQSIWSQSSSGGASSVVRWTSGEFFDCTFKPFTVRLLSNGSALVWVHLQEGYLKTLRNRQPWKESEQYTFSGWRLAFEVPLRMCEQSKLEHATEVWTTRFKQSQIWKEFSDSTGYAYHHIYLDFEQAEFIQELSRFDGLFSRAEKRPVERVHAAVKYVRDYFAEIMHGGYHVLHTIPVWEGPGKDAPPYSLTSVSWRLHSRGTITRQTLTTRERTRSQEPAIVIVGMTGGRPMPMSVPDFPCDWIAHTGKSSSFGTVSFSTRAFLEERLLQHFTEINAATTILPVFAGIEGDQWKLELVRLSEHELRRRFTNCSFKPEPPSGDVLRYKWELEENWTHEHKGSNYAKNQIYSVSCETRNTLEIPTVYKQGAMEMKLTGQVNLRVGFANHSGSLVWEASSSVHWSTSLVARSDASGLRVSIMSSKAPEIHRKTVNGSISNSFVDPEELLRGHFSTGISLDEVLKEFQFFEGSWKSCYPGTNAFRLAQPIFNHNGDLLFEIWPDSTGADIPRARGNGQAVIDGRFRKVNKPRGVQRHLTTTIGTVVDSAEGTIRDGQSTHSFTRESSYQSDVTLASPTTPIHAKSRTPFPSTDTPPPLRDSQPRSTGVCRPVIPGSNGQARGSGSPGLFTLRSPPAAAVVTASPNGFGVVNPSDMNIRTQINDTEPPHAEFRIGTQINDTKPPHAEFRIGTQINDTVPPHAEFRIGTQINDTEPPHAESVIRTQINDTEPPHAEAVIRTQINDTRPPEAHSAMA